MFITESNCILSLLVKRSHCGLALWTLDSRLAPFLSLSYPKRTKTNNLQKSLGTVSWRCWQRSSRLACRLALPHC